MMMVSWSRGGATEEVEEQEVLMFASTGKACKVVAAVGKQARTEQDEKSKTKRDERRAEIMREAYWQLVTVSEGFSHCGRPAPLHALTTRESEKRARRP